MVCLKFKFKKSINNIILCITVVLSKKKQKNESQFDFGFSKKNNIFLAAN